MRTNPIIFSAGLTLLLTLATACSEPAETTPLVNEAKTPEDLGLAILETLAAAHGDVADLLDGRPDPASVQDELLGLREDYLRRFIAIGHKREALSPEDRQKLDNKAAYTRDETYKAAWERYNGFFDHYKDLREQHGDFWRTYKSFNTLSQFAYFELARKQEPEEAARLGL